MSDARNGTVGQVEPGAAPAAEASPSPGEAPPTRRVRVAWIAGGETLERLGQTLQPVAVGLMDEMVEVVVFCQWGADTHGLPSPPLQIVRHNGPRWWWALRPAPIHAMAAEIRKRKADLLHALDASAAGLTRRLARSSGMKYVASSYSLDDGRRLGTLDDHAAGVLAGSDAIRRDLLEHHVAPAEKIHLVRPGTYQVRRPICFNEPQHSVAIVAGGPMDDFSPFEAVMRTFAELRNRRYDCVFFLLGRGRAERRLRALAGRLGLLSQLTFADGRPAPQLPGIFKGADVYISCVPTRDVDIQSLLAMSAGVPVLAASPGAGDFLVDGETATLFEPGRSSELTVKLIALLDDHATARAIAASALKRLGENHSPAKMVGSLSRIYRAAVEQTAPPNQRKTERP